MSSSQDLTVSFAWTPKKNNESVCISIWIAFRLQIILWKKISNYISKTNDYVRIWNVLCLFLHSKICILTAGRFIFRFFRSTNEQSFYCRLILFEIFQDFVSLGFVLMQNSHTHTHTYIKNKCLNTFFQESWTCHDILISFFAWSRLLNHLSNLGHTFLI